MTGREQKKHNDLIKECQIENDYFDITNVKYAIPTHWDMIFPIEQLYRGIVA
jgi:hypothetical protein